MVIRSGKFGKFLACRTSRNVKTPSLSNPKNPRRPRLRPHPRTVFLSAPQARIRTHLSPSHP
ncbi:MAG: hypothetical protein ACLUSP_08875 [Christensenellales bacterium]